MTIDQLIAAGAEAFRATLGDAGSRMSVKRVSDALSVAFGQARVEEVSGAHQGRPSLALENLLSEEAVIALAMSVEVDVDVARSGLQAALASILSRLSAAPEQEVGGDSGANFPPRWGLVDDTRHGEAQFRRLADAMPQLVWLAEPDGTVDFFNSKVTEYDGFAFADGRWEWQPVVHDDDREQTLERWHSSINNGTPYYVEHRIRMTNGSYRWHQSRALPMRDGSGRVTRWFGATTDIHALKVAESELQTARDRLSIALDAAEMGTWETDFVAGTSHRSLRHDQIFGYDELQPEWGLDIARAHVVSEDLDAFEAAVREAEVDGRLRHELRIRRPDGEVRWIFSLGQYYYGVDGKPIRRAGVVMDITERKQAEAELRRLNETLEAQVSLRTAQLKSVRDHFETVFHASPVPAIIVRADDLKATAVNDEFVRFTGVTRETVLDGTVGDLALWSSIPDIQGVVESAALGEATRDLEVRFADCDGLEQTVLLYAAPIKLGASTGALIMCVDLTQRKRAEEAIHHLTSALSVAEQRERKRLSQILHDDLQQIIFGADLRAAILEQHLADPVLPADAIRGHVDSLRELIRRALRATRTLSHELNPPIIDGSGIRDALSWLSRHMEKMHGLTVEAEVSGPEIDCPDQRLFLIQIARELLFNVVKHADVDRARLILHSHHDCVVMTVEDDGVGFDPIAIRSHVERQDSLGLFSVQERVRLVNGAVYIDSAPGSGCRVQIDLPIAQDK